jgi:hypothetical protein
MITGTTAGREDRLKRTRNQEKAWFLHIVKVFPFPDSDLTADKIHGPSSTISGSYPDNVRFMWKPFKLIITFQSVDYHDILYLFPCRLLCARQEKLEKSTGHGLLSTKDKIFDSYSKHPGLHGNESNNLQVT